MDFRLFITRLRLGRPPSGKATTLRRGSYTFEEGTDLAGRFAAAFGEARARTVADFGAGPGETAIARQILSLPFARLVSVEPFGPYLERLERKHSRAAVHEIFRERIENVFDEIPPGEIDVALLVDVLEHFERAKALDLLVRLETWARLGVMIFVPLGRVPQEALDGNELQRHRSVWNAATLARLGYDVIVCEGVHGHLEPPADAAWAIRRKSAPPADEAPQRRA